MLNKQNNMFSNSKLDLIICLSPSEVAHQIQSNLLYQIFKLLKSSIVKQQYFWTLVINFSQKIFFEKIEIKKCNMLLILHSTKYVTYIIKFVDNKQVYEETVSFLIDGVMDGFNATVFAYGATGCGKTYTMVGTQQKPGIMPKCMADLFEKAQNQRISKQVLIKVSYLEIYNENIKDLLISQDKNFELRQDPKLGVVIAGITEVPVHNIMEINALLKVGNRNRAKQATGANETSSRSHGILQVTVEAKQKSQGLNTQIKASKLSLVDLAGSERASNTTNRGMRMVQGAKINQSLLILGNCIQALSDATEKGLKKAFIPYRGSKMTRLLKDSLGGNCRTVMIANVSPAVSSFQDTYNTLMYANRAKSIKTNAQRNVLNVDNHIANYANIISNLRKENQDLKMLLNKNQNELNKLSLPVINPSNQTILLEKIQTNINNHYQQEINILKKYFDNDQQIENIGFHIFKLMIQQDKQKEGNKQGKQNELTKQKIENSKAMIQTFFQKKEEAKKQLDQKMQKRNNFVTEIKSSELLVSNQNYLLTLIKQLQISFEKQQIIYKEKKIQNQSKQKQILITYLKNQVSLRDKIIQEQKILIQKNKIINRITYSKLKDLNQISNQAKLVFPQIMDRGRSLAPVKKQVKRNMERAHSIDKIDRLDYDWLQSPKRKKDFTKLQQPEQMSPIRKPYYNLNVQKQMKKNQLKSQNSVQILSQKNVSKKKKKISYMFPEKVQRREEKSSSQKLDKSEKIQHNRLDRFQKDRQRQKGEKSPMLINPLFIKKRKAKIQHIIPKHDHFDAKVIQR